MRCLLCSFLGKQKKKTQNRHRVWLSHILYFFSVFLFFLRYHRPRARHRTCPVPTQFFLKKKIPATCAASHLAFFCSEMALWVAPRAAEKKTKNKKNNVIAALPMRGNEAASVSVSKKKNEYTHTHTNDVHTSRIQRTRSEHA